MLALVALLPLFAARPALAQAAISFAPTVLQNLFPAGVSFSSQARSSTAPIVAANLVYRVQGRPETTRVTLPIRPGAAVNLAFAWDTRPEALPPGAVVTCHWAAADAAGNQATSAEATLTYEDTRYLWQVRQGDGAAVWWHDAPASLGTLALNITHQAIEHQHRVFQATLPGPVRIMLYNTHDELAAWQPGLPAFVAGRAYPAFALTAQLAQAGAAPDGWLRAVIPHEISRLYFYQATGGAATAPAWLDEGLALYNETAAHDREEAVLQAVILQHGLRPLPDLSPALAGDDENAVRVAQAEALSAVTYLMYRYGPDQLAHLLAAYRAGAASDQAFASALGVTPARFEDEWLMWVGVPAVWRQPRTPASSPAAATPQAAPAAPLTAAPAPSAAEQPAARPSPALPVPLAVAALLLALVVPVTASRSRGMAHGTSGSRYGRAFGSRNSRNDPDANRAFRNPDSGR